jgi:cytochrome P450
VTPLGPHGPWLVTSLEHSKRVLTDAASFDFPTNVSRGTDLSASAADTRTGHHVFAPLTPMQVARGRSVFTTEWQRALDAGAPPGPDGSRQFDALDLLRRPVARATSASVLGDVSNAVRDDVADRVLAWIDALAPVISSRRNPGRWSRARRRERQTRAALEQLLTDIALATDPAAPPSVTAVMLAAGIQVPIAAGAWLLVHLAGHTDPDVDPDQAVWETLRVSPPTWATARVTTARVELAGTQLPAGALVLVSPLLLGRLSALAPDAPATLSAFCPERWRREDVRPGSWLPFGAGAHACPGRTLGLQLLRDLTSWAGQHQIALTSSVTIDQSRGILPAPAHILVTPREETGR